MGESSIAKDICVFGGMCLPLVIADAANRGYISLGQYLTPEQTNYAASAIFGASAAGFFGIMLYESASGFLKERNIQVPNLWAIYKETS